MNLRTTSASEADVVTAAEWFESQRSGLGNDFLDDVEAVFEDIQRSPLGFPTLQLADVALKLQLRWNALGRFSYLTIYHVGSDEILIVAVLNSHRDLETILRSRVGVR